MSRGSTTSTLAPIAAIACRTSSAMRAAAARTCDERFSRQTAANDSSVNSTATCRAIDHRPGSTCEPPAASSPCTRSAAPAATAASHGAGRLGNRRYRTTVRFVRGRVANVPLRDTPNECLVSATRLSRGVTTARWSTTTLRIPWNRPCNRGRRNHPSVKHETRAPRPSPARPSGGFAVQSPAGVRRSSVSSAEPSHHFRHNLFDVWQFAVHSSLIPKVVHRTGVNLFPTTRVLPGRRW